MFLLQLNCWCHGTADADDRVEEYQKGQFITMSIEYLYIIQSPPFSREGENFSWRVFFLLTLSIFYLHRRRWLDTWHLTNPQYFANRSPLDGNPMEATIHPPSSISIPQYIFAQISGSFYFTNPRCPILHPTPPTTNKLTWCDFLVATFLWHQPGKLGFSGGWLGFGGCKKSSRKRWESYSNWN